MILVVMKCGVCNGTAGVGMDSDHADFNMVESGGRKIAGLRVCKHCARVTR